MQRIVAETSIVCLMKRIRSDCLFIIVFMCLTLTSEITAADYQGEGREKLTGTYPRELALARALSNALANAGIESVTADEIVQSYRMLVAAFRSIHDYEVISAEPNEDGEYCVRVSVTPLVGDIPPGTFEALLHLVKLKGPPQLFFGAQLGYIHFGNLPGSSLHSEPVSEVEAWANRPGKGYLYLPTESQSDFSVFVRSDTTLVKKASSDGNCICQLRVSLAAIPKGSTNEVALTHLHPVTFTAPVDDLGDETARQATKVLKSSDLSVADFYQQLFSQWVVQCDLGRLWRLKCVDMSAAETEGLKEELRNQEGVRCVWSVVRAQDSSVICLEGQIEKRELETMLSQLQGYSLLAEPSSFESGDIVVLRKSGILHYCSSNLYLICGGAGILVTAGVVFWGVCKRLRQRSETD